MPNYLLGNGEFLTSPYKIPPSGGPGKPEYTIEEAKERLRSQAESVILELKSYPINAYPEDTAVFCLQKHPRFEAASHFPRTFFTDHRVKLIGSRSKLITPHKYLGVLNTKTSKYATYYYVSIKLQHLNIITEIIEMLFTTALENQRRSKSKVEEIQKIEGLFVPQEDDKIISKPATEGYLELLLHTKHFNKTSNLINYLDSYSKTYNANIIESEIINIENISFIPVRVSSNTDYSGLSRFSMLRSMRIAPQIVPIKPRTISTPVMQFNPPTNAPPPDSPVVAVLDCGIKNPHPFGMYVQSYSAHDITSQLTEAEAFHGTTVTSAVLYGPIDDVRKISSPTFTVDHWRVIDELNDSSPIGEFKIIRRIKKIIEDNKSKYKFINLSLGPDEPIDTSDISLWTALLDHLLDSGKHLMTVAAGNNGKPESNDEANRIQPPSDAVNLLGVGASTRQKKWSRTDYSCVGPGRSPGLVKPDLIAYGGTDADPFIAVSHKYNLIGVSGTSYSAPYLLRSGVKLWQEFSGQLNLSTIRALIINLTETRGRKKGYNLEDGWGKLYDELEQYYELDDNEVTVVYQGYLKPKQFVRAKIPIPPDIEISKNVEISATICYNSTVEHYNPSEYTNIGLEVVFRPNDNVYSVRNDGTQSIYPKAGTFFRKGSPQLEIQLRRDALKWETVRKQSRRFDRQKLKNPVFDLHVIGRRSGQLVELGQEVPYSMVISTKHKTDKDWYNKVLTGYQQLVALLPLSVRVQLEAQIK